MEEHSQTEVSQISPPEVVEAYWAGVHAKGQANMEKFADAEHRGRPEAAAAQADANALDRRRLVACLSNTPPQSSAIPLPGFPQLSYTCGIDWWEWSGGVVFENAPYSKLTATLDAGKELCQEQQREDGWVKLDGVSCFRIGRTGFKRGGGRSEYYDYRITHNGITIGLANRPGDKEGMPNFCVIQRGSDCLRLGALLAQGSVRDFIRRLGGKIVREKLSRADVCIDVRDLDIRTFEPLIRNRQFVTVAKSVQPYENVAADEWTGFVVGKRPLRIVAYDKVRELTKKQDALYLQAMIERRWGGSLPKYAARIELQIAREWLRKFGIETPDDFIAKGSAIVERQLSRWFRLTTTRVESEKKTQSRAKTCPLWSAMRDAVVNWFGIPEAPLVPIDRKKVQPLRTIKQGLGCLQSAFLQMGYVLPTTGDFKELVGIAMEMAYPTATDRERFLTEYARRSSEYLA